MRVSASLGFCCAIVFIDDALASSSGGEGGGPPEFWAEPDCAAGADGATTRGVPCCEPMIQPTSTPKNTPATPTMRASLDTVKDDHTLSEGLRPSDSPTRA